MNNTLSAAALAVFGPPMNTHQGRAVLDYLTEAIEMTRAKENRRDIEVGVLENLLLIRYLLFSIPTENPCTCKRVTALCHPVNCEQKKALVEAETPP